MGGSEVMDDGKDPIMLALQLLFAAKKVIL
jgi:hypothetical protein